MRAWLQRAAMLMLLVFLARLLAGPQPDPGSVAPPEGATRPAVYAGWWTGSYTMDGMTVDYLDYMDANGGTHSWFKEHHKDGTVERNEEYGTWWVEGGSVMVIVSTFVERGSERNSTFLIGHYQTTKINDRMHCYRYVDADPPIDFCSTRVDKGYKF